MKAILLAFTVWVFVWFTFVAMLNGQDTNQPTNKPPTISNPSAQGEASNYLNTLVQWNDKLLGLPALPLLVVACIAFCYSLKAMPFADDKWIPAWNFACGVGGNCILGLVTMNFKAPFYVVVAVMFKNALLGMIASVAAWMIHKRFLKPLEKKFGWDSDTDVIARGKTESGSKITVTENPAPEAPKEKDKP